MYYFSFFIGINNLKNEIYISDVKDYFQNIYFFINFIIFSELLSLETTLQNHWYKLCNISLTSINDE